ncbi:prolyl 3-hydroxylase 2-like [Pollicipes pollicipes]|uniref:prolyl 3-hydroxylase 2-like n=1 Tax=Pollicipes pollicipes TaxID=41117 RepID=UPI001884B677|nr:prolyl 3-hydroxylase 2-like [Pollicipes pollicipes]
MEVSRVARCAVLALTVLALTGRGVAVGGGPHAYGELFQLGKDAYLEEDYQSCVNLLLEALQSQRAYEQLLLDCRDRCREEAGRETLMLDDQQPDELRVFERLIRQTRCLVQCQRQRLGNHLQEFYDSAWADEEFRTRKPYEYLQLCYYKTGEVQKAADAVFTVLQHSPNSEIMRENFKYYTTMDEVDNANIVSMERQEHTELYLRGNDAYESGRFEQVVRFMEDALDSYLEAEQRCRTLCERHFPQGFNPDFVANVANHFAYVLRCKIRCQDQLSKVNGNQLTDYLESHFHYLQFAYFKQNRLPEACSSVASYLLFRPEDEDMLGNKRLYLKEDGVDESSFVPRPDIVEFAKRREREKKLDRYILDNFRFSDDASKKKGELGES